jgi:uncharacterized protein YbjT (DUF2867 family)
MTAAQPRILVIGATGLLGAPVVRHLLQAGWAVRALVRRPESARQRLDAAVEVIQGDVTDEASVARALQGCQAVHISLQGSNRAEFEQVEHRGTATVARLAAAQGVARLTHLSGALVSARTTHVPQERAKWEAETAIERSGVPYTIFKPTFFMESLPLNIQGTRATVMGPSTRKFRFVAANDYAALVVKALQTPATINQRLEVYGPQALTLREATAQVARALNPAIQISQTPFLMMKILNRLFMSGKLTHIIELMALTEAMGETGNPELTTRLLGTPSTTLDQWCAALPRA